MSLRLSGERRGEDARCRNCRRPQRAETIAQIFAAILCSGPRQAIRNSLSQAHRFLHSLAEAEIGRIDQPGGLRKAAFLRATDGLSAPQTKEDEFERT